MKLPKGNKSGPLTPEAKLADKKWRYTNSWWILLPPLSLGFLSWLAFMVPAIRTGKKSYWLWAGVYAFVFAVFMTLVTLDNEKNGVYSDFAMIPFLVSWVAATVHAVIVNRDYLRLLAAKGDWYRNPSSATGSPSYQANTPVLGVADSDYYGANTPVPQVQPHPQPHRPRSTPPQPWQQSPPNAAPSTAPAAPVEGPLHANTATLEALSGLPGVGPVLAKRIVDIRDARGGYRDIDDLASAANLQPHELVRVREHLTFDKEKPTTPEDQPRPGRTGRILDI